MNTLFVTVGLPRSGKSTWARIQGHPIVCPDAIRLALHGQAFQPLAEPFVWATAQVMVRALVNAGHENVILDATSIKVEYRKVWADEAKRFGWNLTYVVFDVRKEVCIDRVYNTYLHSTSHQAAADLINVIERMALEFAPVREWEFVGTGTPLVRVGL